MALTCILLPPRALSVRAAANSTKSVRSGRLNSVHAGGIHGPDHGIGGGSYHLCAGLLQSYKPSDDRHLLTRISLNRGTSSSDIAALYLRREPLSHKIPQMIAGLGTVLLSHSLPKTYKIFCMQFQFNVLSDNDHRMLRRICVMLGDVSEV